MPTCAGSLWVRSARTTPGGTSSRLWGGLASPPPPMEAAVLGSKGEVSADLPTEVALLVMRANGQARGVHFRPWIVTSAACQHPSYVQWYKQPPERRRPSLEV